jgi:NADH-quinone oxidoreductase subunit J
MMPQNIIFWALAALSVVSAVMVFRVDSMARATFALLASFCFAAGEVILLGFGYLGVVIVLMMVMEMVIMPCS